jgi:dihydroorotase
VSISELVEKLSLAPRRTLGLDVPAIKLGEKAELTVFDPELSWTYQASDIRSRSKNSPFVGQTFKGKAIGVVNNGVFARS